MNDNKDYIHECGLNDLVLALSLVENRLDLWVRFARLVGVSRMAEIGVWRAEFAESILRACEDIDVYYMLDPWRNLPDWNKPFNVDGSEFEKIFAEAEERTRFAGHRRVLLRGRTTEVIDRIDDASLDFLYIDGDHTLRGITIDFNSVLSKSEARRIHRRRRLCSFSLGPLGPV